MPAAFAGRGSIASVVENMKKAIIAGYLAVMAIALAGACTQNPEQEYAEPAPIEETQEEDAKADESFLTDELINDIDSGYLVLVNKSNEIDKSKMPDDLVGIKYYAADRSAEGRRMRAAAADAFHRLAEEAKKRDMTIVITTAYRSYEFQSRLYNYYVAADGQEEADKYSAQPGKSEHQTGLAADISSPSVNYKLTLDFAESEEGKWLAENAHLFGFIIRYPEGKEELTGYRYEPWHIRYVGLPAAEYMHEHNCTLEEYLQILNEKMEE